MQNDNSVGFICIQHELIRHKYISIRENGKTLKLMGAKNKHIFNIRI